jgi:hypothetical protein
LQSTNTNKTIDIVWPHRYNSDKQPAIAEDLAQHYTVLMTQKQHLPKEQYYEQLTHAKIVFSCSLHENLGIGVAEGVFAGAIPVLPQRCSYAEMYELEFLYPSEYTTSFDAYQYYKPQLLNFINERLTHPEKYATALARQQFRLAQYFNATTMTNNLTRA